MRKEASANRTYLDQPAARAVYRARPISSVGIQPVPPLLIRRAGVVHAVNRASFFPPKITAYVLRWPEVL